MKKRAFPKFGGEEGSFTLEATMVFPVIFIALIALILMSMYIYQKVVLYDEASLSAERVAFRWDNSYRDPASGIGQTGKYDGLYWRMSGNGALQSLFGWGGTGDEKYTIAIGEAAGGKDGEAAGGKDGEEDSGGSSLPVIKMNSTAASIPDPYHGEMQYAYGFLEKKIGVKLLQPLSIAPLEALFGISNSKSVGSAVIVDPVELIRNVDLVRYYTAKFSKDGDGGAERKKVSQTLLDRKSAMAR